MWIINIIAIITTFTYFDTKRVNIGLLLFILITCGLVLHSWFFIEIQLKGIASNGITFMKFDKIVNPTKNTFLTNLNIFIYIMLFFSLKIYECL